MFLVQAGSTSPIDSRGPLGATGKSPNELPPMPLTDTKVKNAKPGLKTVRLFDEKGLYLEVSPSGGKWWRFKYRFNGKEKRLSLGVYPDVTLKAARDRRDGTRTLVANNIDPGEHRKATKAAQAVSATETSTEILVMSHSY
jgi:hypothetical protein